VRAQKHCKIGGRDPHHVSKAVRHGRPDWIQQRTVRGLTSSACATSSMVRNSGVVGIKTSSGF
jgi:hypothetical protein